MTLMGTGVGKNGHSQNIFCLQHNTALNLSFLLQMASENEEEQKWQARWVQPQLRGAVLLPILGSL